RGLLSFIAWLLYSEFGLMKREYSVMFPLFCDNGEWKIVFELRSKDLSAHKGEISLPGAPSKRARVGETRRFARPLKSWVFQAIPFMS
ncbi:MAG: hypothetical protein Q4A41_04125, partial [Bacillota bacterium]|nr:hypothetical protein [Bacillota bacterium]